MKFNYCPQRSCEGYIFTPVCHSFHRGVCLSACWDTTPPRGSPREAPREEASPPPEVHPTGGIPLEAHTLQGGNPQKAPPRGTHTPGGTPWEASGGKHTPPRSTTPPPGDGCRCGRYASYWNAFSLKFNFTDIS